MKDLRWLGGRGVRSAVIVFLFLALGLQLWLSMRRQSISWDEDDHLWAGYMSLTRQDYGINPEHPPLLKMVAALPLLGMSLHLPQQHPERNFKSEAFLNGRDFLFQNNANEMLAWARTSVAVFTFLLAALVLLAAWEMFGAGAGLLALAFFVFEPNLIAHGAFVTTDMALSCFLFASLYAFFRYVRRPGWGRLGVTGLAVGLLLASKHSGILIFPMLGLLLLGELWLSEERGRALWHKALRWCGALVAIAAIGVAILWAFYGFRYAARPAELALSPSLAESLRGMAPGQGAFVALCARWHLLPESYLYGLLDVQQLSLYMPTYIFGKVHAHGVWYYFPCAYAIKATLGVMAMLAIALWAVATRRIRAGREMLYLALPALFYAVVAMCSGVNIGARHILPIFMLGCVLAAGGGAAWRRWLCWRTLRVRCAASPTTSPTPTRRGADRRGCMST